MTDKIKEIALWLLNQGAGITRDVLEEKLQEAYNQGRLDSYGEQVNKTLDDILYNTTQLIRSKKMELYEKNFYNVPSEEDAAQMRAYEFLTENLSTIIKNCRES